MQNSKQQSFFVEAIAFIFMKFFFQGAEDVIEILIDAEFCHDYQKETELTFLDCAKNLQKFEVLRILIQNISWNIQIFIEH